MGDAWIWQRKQPIVTQKYSTKRLPRVTHGFDSANSPCGLKISMKTESQSTQKSSTKMLPQVTHGFDSANSLCGLRNHQRNCFHMRRMDSTAQIAPMALKILNETASTGDAWIR
jgi:hypothetical protein